MPPHTAAGLQPPPSSRAVLPAHAATQPPGCLGRCRRPESHRQVCSQSQNPSLLWSSRFWSYLLLAKAVFKRINKEVSKQLFVTKASEVLPTAYKERSKPRSKPPLPAQAVLQQRSPVPLCTSPPKTLFPGPAASQTRSSQQGPRVTRAAESSTVV